MTARIFEHYRDLVAPLAAERNEGRTLALSNGCFDLLHVGHVRLIREACELADILVVAVNSDASVRVNKGPGRPVMPFRERLEVLAALAGVTYVTGFDETTASEILAALRPDLHVKGKDWTAPSDPEREVVTGYGGRVVIAGDALRRSSSDLIAKMQRS